MASQALGTAVDVAACRFCGVRHVLLQHSLYRTSVGYFGVVSATANLFRHARLSASKLVRRAVL